MTPFLKQIATIFYDRYGQDIHRMTFVFPNKRSGMFFRKYLSEAAARPVFSPAILTINDLFQKLNPKQQADRIKLLFMLYDIYKRQSDGGETFDDFVYWGEMLLNDFDDIDKYLVDARQLFTNVTDINRIDETFAYLTPSQIQAIRSFWSSFGMGGNDKTESYDSNRRFFLHIWELLYPVYTELRERLAAEGMAYEGMIYREVVENLEKMPSPAFKKIVFIGFNALTKAEKMLFKHLKEQGIADFYWDYASEKIKDEDNRASFFMNENLRLFPSEHALPEEEAEQTQFELIGVPSRIGQAKQVYTLLEKLSEKGTMRADEAMRTAIVLPDEQLLMPVLNAIPEPVSRINVTLGYPLSGTLVASLMNSLQSLRKNVRITDDDIRFYHRDVIAVLRHKYISSALPAETSALVKDITEHNQIYIPVKTFEKSPLLTLLFSTPATAAETFDYLTDILEKLNVYLLTTDEENAGTNELTSATNAETNVRSDALEQEFLFYYYSMVNRMRELIREAGTDMSTDTCFRLLRKMTDSTKIPFYGEPLSGLQIMGTLETRALDFENLILLSVNEGIFPAKSTANSFIPYHLRKGFDLPSPEHQDAIWAYHFYRMIYRAKKVTMLYDTRADGLQSGEVSRFIRQLIYHYQTPVQRKLSVYDVSSSHVAPLCVDKDEDTMRLLTAYEADKSLSASAINIYLDCPLKFYFSVLRGINEEEAVSETLENDTFGTILHHVMELTYKPLCGKTVTADLLKLAAQEKNMTAIIQQAFADDFFHTEKPHPLTGQAYLYGETIRKYACKALEYDRSTPPFVYIGSEKLFHTSLEIKGGRKIRIKGFIDRIDRIGDIVRITDYKSGRPSALTFGSMESLFDMTAKERKKAILQVFLYAWIYAKEDGEKNLRPEVFYMRNLFGREEFDPLIRQVNGKEKTVIENFSLYHEAFEEHLRNCLNEMFDAEKPFTQTQNPFVCEYCPFTGICGR
ncbi:MAG: PD-(D/E)XK nuclease family protein [Tannerella sp.]|nr:PD-(D/E)XK nuclease family protein [Tannerella sp.]